MTDAEVRHRFLSQLTEDYTGLWELTGTAGLPPLGELIRILDGLVKDGLVGIYTGSKFTSEEKMLSADEACRAIRNQAFWEWSAPSSGEHVRAFATRSGADVYFSKPRMVR
jgi:hypothetical protein